jgi:hypothetical protein
VRTEVSLAFTTVTRDETLAAGSAALMASTLCGPTADGAVYTPLLVIVPVVALPLDTPSTAHVTLVFDSP